MKNIILTLTFGALLLAAPSYALADSYGQYGQYGAPCSTGYGQSGYGQGCSENQIKIDKKILMDTKGGNTYVDSLSINETRMTKNQKVTFQIAVTNVSDSNLSGVQVQDIFPDYLSYVSGPGSYDSNSRTLTFSTDLKAGETKKFSVIGKVTDPKNISNGSVCVVNQAIATTQSGETEQDNASYCIEKGLAVMPAPKMTTTPGTGAEALPLIGMIPAALAGFALRRKSK